MASPESPIALLGFGPPIVKVWKGPQVIFADKEKVPGMMPPFEDEELSFSTNPGRESKTYYHITFIWGRTHVLSLRYGVTGLEVTGLEVTPWIKTANGMLQYSGHPEYSKVDTTPQDFVKAIEIFKSRVKQSAEMPPLWPEDSPFLRPGQAEEILGLHNRHRDEDF